MALLVVYEAGIAATYEDITDRVRVGSLDITQNAEEGSVALSTIVIDDPDGDYEIKGFRRIGIYETEGTTGVSALTYHGFIVDRKVIRGPYRTGAGRQWVCSVADTNAYLEMRLMVGTDANRPAETDVERVLWLMTTSEMNRIADSTDYINTTGPVNMDAADYRGQRAVDVLNDCAQASGKNYYAFALDGAALPPPYVDSRHVWYDWADSVERSSTLKLSNDLADIQFDPACFEISLDTELVRDPARVYSGGIGAYDGGEVYEEDLDISNEFTRRDTVIPMSNVKTEAKATARVLRQLADMATEEDRITTAVVLPAAQLNLIREGMRISFKATHLPEEYHEFTWQRILQRKVKQLTEEFYLVTLTLGTGPSWPPAAVLVPGEGSMYFAQYAGYYPTHELYVNGTPVSINGSHNSSWIDVRYEIPDGLLVSGENVIAVGIQAVGTGPQAWWGGCWAAFILRAYLGEDDSGTLIGYTTAGTKIWAVSNFWGTLGGEPSGWEDLAFDDSGWDGAVDVGPIPASSGQSPDDNIVTPPALWIGVPEAVAPLDLSNTYPFALILLIRIHFTI